jgi:hypothetical protein
LREYAPTRGFPQVNAQRASVLFYRSGGYSVVTVSGVQHVDKRALARPYIICEIALGTYVAPLQMELPAAGGTTFFKAEVDIQWTVTDPYLAALEVVTDVAGRLTSPVRERLREVTTTYRVTEAEQANRAITRECASGRWADLGSELGLRVRLYVRLWVDDRTIGHADEERDAQAQANVTRLRREVFRHMLRGGELEQLSFMLAADPDAVKDFLEKIREEGGQDEKERVARLLAMAARGELATVDVETQALDLLNEGRLGGVQGPIGSVPLRQDPQQLEPSPDETSTPASNTDATRTHTDDFDASGPLPPRTPTTPTAEPRRLVAELAEQTSPGREVPLHVQIVRGSGRDGRGVQLRPLFLPPDGARVLITIHAPGLVVVDELQQELHVVPGRDSDVLRFRLKAPTPGLHQVTVRAFRGGTFLGEVTCQISVEHDSVTRDGPQRHAPLPSMAFDPGEITLQVLKDEAAGTFSFQLIRPQPVDRLGGGEAVTAQAVHIPVLERRQPCDVLVLDVVALGTNTLGVQAHHSRSPREQDGRSSKEQTARSLGERSVSPNRVNAGQLSADIEPSPRRSLPSNPVVAGRSGRESLGGTGPP